MRSWLSLVPISAKVHKRRNRMTILCIVIAVFLVTAIFSMADMGLRMEKQHSIEGHGNWHIVLKNVPKNDAELIGARSDIAVSSWYDTVNLDMDKDYEIGGRRTALCGIEEAFADDIMSYFTEGTSLKNEEQIILSENAKGLLGVDVGDTVTLNTPSGSHDFIVSGFRSGSDRYMTGNGGESTALLVKEDQIGAFMDIRTFRRICVEENHEETSPVYYIRFKNHTNMKKAVAELKEQYNLADENITQNTIVMGSMGLGDNAYAQNFYSIAVVLFVLILAAGVLMITSSLNSNIAERAQFFGMLRCIGASKKQVTRFVRREALAWCKTAIPEGVMLGIVVTWGLCAMLRFGVGGEFSDIQLWGVSAVGIVSGVAVGLVTVLIAAQSPAKRAARVSPMAAVSGSGENAKKIRHGANLHLGRIETALGIHHAASAKKNMILMTGSFALSIILFFSFSVLIELVGCLLPSKESSPDLSIASTDLSDSIDSGLIDEISVQTGIKRAFGRMTRGDIPAKFSRDTEQDTVDMISYDEYQIDCIPQDEGLRKGSDLSKVYGDSGYVLTIYDRENPLENGDKIWVNGEELEVAGVLRYNPFSNDGSTYGKIILICSEETFTRLTGDSSYAIIDIQMKKDASKEDAERIRQFAGESCEFVDRWTDSDRNMYTAFMLFVYGFLAVIACISALNIVNSISMSVSARIKQYGAMRAVGMDGRQITKMIAAETMTYALSGCVIGCALGLPLSKFLYDYVITSHFYYFTWKVPVGLVVISLIFILASSAAAVYAPAKRIRNMAITDTINEL